MAHLREPGARSGANRKMKRKVIRIDEERCDGCGLCVQACAEGAIRIVDGKARLVSETYCDGLGACIGECPRDAIAIEEREAEPFSPGETPEDKPRGGLRSQRESEPFIPGAIPHRAPSGPHEHAHGTACPGAAVLDLAPAPSPAGAGTPATGARSELSNWPVKLRLVPPAAPFLRGADLLLCADCVPFASAEFHGRLLRGRPVLIACPKLDDPAAHVEKLRDILALAAPRSLTVVHMEVPCCFGLARIAEAAMNAAACDLPLRDVTVGVRGAVLRER